MNIRIKANKESGQRLSARDLGLLGKFPVLPIIHHNSKCQVMWCWRAFTKAVSFIFFFPFGFSLEDTDYLTSLCPSFSSHSFVLQAFCFTEGRAQCGEEVEGQGISLLCFICTKSYWLLIEVYLVSLEEEVVAVLGPGQFLGSFPLNFIQARITWEGEPHLKKTPP